MPIGIESQIIINDFSALHKVTLLNNPWQIGWPVLKLIKNLSGCWQAWSRVVTARFRCHLQLIIHAFLSHTDDGSAQLHVIALFDERPSILCVTDHIWQPYMAMLNQCQKDYRVERPFQNISNQMNRHLMNGRWVGCYDYRLRINQGLKSRMQIGNG